MSDAERVQILRDAIRKVEHYVVGPMAHWTLADALERTKPEPVGVTARHPLADAVSPEELREIVNQVQYAEITWPQCYEMGDPIWIETEQG